MNKKALLIYASSEIDNNQRYISNFLAPDPFIGLMIGNKKYLVLSQLEYGRAKYEVKNAEILLAESFGRTGEEIIGNVFKKLKIKQAEVPANFPLYLAEKLKKKKIKIKVKIPFLAERQVKTKEEQQYIAQTQKFAQQAMQRVIKIIKEAKVKQGKLYFDGIVLTSEFLRKLVSQYAFGHGYLMEKMIISCGTHSALPHHEGKGPLLADQPIILDFFPKSLSTGYCGDLTRTVVHGKPEDEIFKMYAAVKQAQELALKSLHSGVDGKKVFKEVIDYLKFKGFQTELNPNPQGMIHSLGHGLGLDLHELPSLSSKSTILKTGNVVTVEPGLYYPKLGGVRIEDAVVIEKSGIKNLTTISKKLVV